MTTKTALRKARTTGAVHGLKAVGDPADGVFEAYVSIFGNVDYHGDRILPGAFESSIERWKSSGDPVPVIFSHQWDDLDAHIGSVIDLEEHLPGDERLPESIRENGGLWTRFELELDEDFASRVAKKLTKRTIREFSFAYDVLDEQRGSDGANELVELEILEVGPTLKGANPATVLLAKALGDDLDGLSEDEVLDRLAKAVADRSEAKARVSVTFEGSIEEELEELYSAAVGWATDLDVGTGGFYFLHSEATYPAELRSIVLVEGWEDPVGEGIFYELTFERAEDGSLAVKEAAEIEVSVELSRKARAWKHRGRSPLAEKSRATVTTEPTGKGTGNPEDPERGNGEDPDSRTGSETSDGGDPALVDLELLELELS
jgi:HK97 family phage prohead protease